MNKYLLATMIVAVACSGESSLPPVVSDSAGVTIVENFGPTWSRNEAWSVSVAPTLSIGDAAQGEDYAFERVVGALRLSDGTIVVANRATQELRWYDASGSFQLSVGRTGTGGVTFSNLANGRGTGDDAIRPIHHKTHHPKQ